MKRFGGKALGIAAIAVVLSVVLSGCFQNDLLQLARSISHNTFTLTVIASEGGTTTPSGAIEVTPSVPAPISATAASGYQFINWEITSGAGASFGNGTAASTTVTLTSEDVTVRAVFSINQIATPQFSVPQGTYTSIQNVAITCATAGASIYYTTNGVDDPTEASTPYGGAILLNVPDATTEIRARAYKAGMTTSIIASSTYLITGTVANPVITPTPAAANPADSFSVAITCATGGVTIRYTVNGDAPSSTVGTVYTTGVPFTVTRTCTVRAIAYKTNWADSSVISVNLTHAWVKNYGTTPTESAYGIARAADGGYYVAGATSAAGYNRRLMKLNQNGTVAWAKSYNDRGAGIGSCVVATADGNIVTVGINTGIPSKAVTTKLNSTGATISVMKTHHPFASEGGGFTTIRSIRELPDGSFIAAGETNDDMAPLTASMLTKLYSNLSDQWAVQIGPTSLPDTISRGYAVDILKTGVTVNGFVMVGAIGEGTSSTEFDVLIVRTNASGVIQNTWVYGGSSANVDDQAYGVRCTSDGGFIVVGKTKTVTFGQASYDAFVLKFNNSWTLQWQKYFGALNTDDVLYAVEEVETGVYLVVGETLSFSVSGTDAWVVKLDSTGEFVWQKTYGGLTDEKAYDICLAEDGGYVVAGSTTSYGTAGDMWILKLATDGRPVYTNGNLKLGVEQTSQNSTYTLSALAVATSGTNATTLPEEPLAGQVTADVSGWTTARQYQP